MIVEYSFKSVLAVSSSQDATTKITCLLTDSFDLRPYFSLSISPPEKVFDACIRFIKGYAL